MSKLALCEFIKYSNLDDIIMEEYDWSDDRETNKLMARQNNTQINRDNNKQEADTIKHQQQGAIVKDALVDFIVNQLPNIRFQTNRLSLGDMVLKNKGNLTDTINKQELKPWFHMLCASVRGFLQSQNHDNVVSLLKPYGGNITQLVNAIAPEVTQKLQHGSIQNGTK